MIDLHLSSDRFFSFFTFFLNRFMWGLFIGNPRLRLINSLSFFLLSKCFTGLFQLFIMGFALFRCMPAILLGFFYCFFSALLASRLGRRLGLLIIFHHKIIIYCKYIIRHLSKTYAIISLSLIKGISVRQSFFYTFRNALIYL